MKRQFIFTAQSINIHVINSQSQSDLSSNKKLGISLTQPFQVTATLSWLEQVFLHLFSSATPFNHHIDFDFFYICSDLIFNWQETFHFYCSLCSLCRLVQQVKWYSLTQLRTYTHIQSTHSSSSAVCQIVITAGERLLVPSQGWLKRKVRELSIQMIQFVPSVCGVDNVQFQKISQVPIHVEGIQEIPDGVEESHWRLKVFFIFLTFLKV